MPSQTYWTHSSVLALAENRNPIEVVVEKARALVLTAIEAGWSGPPFDPFALAELLRIPVVPRDDIKDARIVPGSSGARLVIEYNPSRPHARIRYSIAHEIAHTLFPDCRDRVRHRAPREHMERDDWQLEMLCNIAASELLMPVGSFPELASESLSIDNLISLRAHYEVSAEALLLRFARLTHLACFVFAASRREKGPNKTATRLTMSIFQPNGGILSKAAPCCRRTLPSVIARRLVSRPRQTKRGHVTQSNCTLKLSVSHPIPPIHIRESSVSPHRENARQR